MGATFSYNNSLFYLVPLTAYNQSSDAVKEALKPWTDHMDLLGVNYSATFTEFPSYYTHWTTFVSSGPVGAYWQGSSRLVPLNIFSDAENLADFMKAQRRLADLGVFAGVTAVAPRKRTGFANAVFPAWRDAVGLYGMLVGWSDDPAQWSEMQEMQEQVDQEMTPIMVNATGGWAGIGNMGTGMYLNEASWNITNWSNEFFGENLARLEAVKGKWDPNGVFWGLRLVGSDGRKVHGQPRDIGDGRLCEVERIAV
jgi:hypothetical protein